MADKEFTQICKEILELNTKITELNSQVETNAGQVAAKTAEVLNAKGVVEGLNSAISIIKSDMDSKKEDFDAKYNQITSLLTQLNELKGQIENILQNSPITDKTISPTTAYSSQKIEQIKLVIESSIQTLTQTQTSLQSQIQTANQGINSLKQQVTDRYTKREVNDTFLGKTATAADSSKLGGLNASDYRKVADSYAKNETYTQVEIDEKLQGIDSYPIGAYVLWSSEAKTPAGFLKADGRSLKKAEYAELFAIIGYTYGGSGDNFNLPNFSDGKFIRSIGGNAAPLGQNQTDAIRNITGRFGYTGYNMFHNIQDGAFSLTDKASQTFSGNSSSTGYSTVAFDASRVVPTANENRPYNTSVVVLIKAKNVKEPTNLPDTTIYATEAKAGIVKIKNSINGNSEDMAVTEKAVNTKLNELENQIIGVNQTWQDVTSQRQKNVVYTNSTNKPILAAITIGGTSHEYYITVYIGSARVYHFNQHKYRTSLSLIIPPGATYKVENGEPVIWFELR